MKAGTRIELHGTPAIGGFPAVAPEMAKVARARRGESVPGIGWHIVAFNDGGRLCVHETRFRVIDNR